MSPASARALSRVSGLPTADHLNEGSPAIADEGFILAPRAEER